MMLLIFETKVDVQMVSTRGVRAVCEFPHGGGPFGTVYLMGRAPLRPELTRRFGHGGKGTDGV